SLTAGTFISSISRDERRAWSSTFALIFCFVALIPTLATNLRVPGLAVLSPFTAFWLHDANHYAAAAGQFWSALWIPHLISWLWLALASALLPRVWQEAGARRVQRRRRAELPGERSARNELLAINPVWWLTSRNTHQRGWLWVFVIIFAAIAIVSFFAAHGSTSILWSIFGCAVAVHLALAVWVAFEACNSF